MKKVKYVGEGEILLPTLNLEVKQDDIIEVPDDFNSVLFEDVEVKKSKQNKEDDK